MKRILLFAFLLTLLSACSNSHGNVRPALRLPTSTFLPRPISTASAIPIPTLTATVAFTETARPIPTRESVPVWKKQGPGKITCPILLYHHIAITDHPSQYYVSPAEFRAQMQALKDWGYTSIPVTLLVKAINFGARLPARPVVISFDDGDISVYSEAFPVMQALGFTGVNYLVVNYIGGQGFMDVRQLKELAAAGWETGSHSMTHIDLTGSTRPEWEVVQSRHSLEKLLGVPVETFAYPFGKKNAYLLALARDNYRAALGLGALLEQTPNNLFYLWRRPVDAGWDVQTFGSYLPWNSPPADK